MNQSWTDDVSVAIFHMAGDEVVREIEKRNKKKELDQTTVVCHDCGAEHDYREKCPG